MAAPRNDNVKEKILDAATGLLDTQTFADISLAEIAEQEGISRQGVHDAISRSEALLAAFERVTGCVAREQKLRHALAAITAEAQPLLQAGDPATRQGAQRILAAVDSLKE